MRKGRGAAMLSPFQQRQRSLHDAAQCVPVAETFAGSLGFCHTGSSKQRGSN